PSRRAPRCTSCQPRTASGRAREYQPGSQARRELRPLGNSLSEQKSPLSPENAARQSASGDRYFVEHFRYGPRRFPGLPACGNGPPHIDNLLVPITATLGTRRLCRTDSAACWSDNSKVCSVITLV